MSKLIYAIREADNKIVSIEDVSSGQYCGCICPQCKGRLIARKGTKNMHHFAHFGNQTRDCNIVSANESALHKMAKRIILEEHQMIVPAIEIHRDDLSLNEIPYEILENLPSIYTYKEAEMLLFQNIKFEKQYYDFVPDIVGETFNKMYFIEIAVSHFVDDKKKKKVEKYGTSMLEIDLSKFVDKPISETDLKDIIINSNELKRWIYHPETITAYNKAEKFYLSHQLVNNYLNKVKLEEENKAKNRQKVKELNEKSFEKYKKLIVPENYKNELMTLRDDSKLYNRCHFDSNIFNFYHDYQEIPFFVDIPISGEMIFKCDRRIWQSIIFDRWIYSRKNECAKINVPTIFEKLKNEYNILTDFELSNHNLNQLSPFGSNYSIKVSVIIQYMKWLEYIGFIHGHQGFATVLQSNSIIPPFTLKMSFLKEALDSIDLYSPYVDKLLEEKVYQQELKYKKIEDDEDKRKKKETLKQIKKNREKEEYQLGKIEVQNMNFNQKDYIVDSFGNRWFYCEKCNNYCRQKEMASWIGNKGICHNCCKEESD